MDKYIKDGKVAVLYSPRYGAGWSTWNRDIPECLFDPEVVQMVLDDRQDEIQEFCQKKYPDGYWGGADTLTIVWMNEGQLFTVSEYDGNESIKYPDDNDYYTA